MAGAVKSNALKAMAAEGSNIGVRLLEHLTKEIPPEEVAAGIKELMQATTKVRTGSESSEEVPDYKVRLSAIQIYLSYMLGMPVQRTISNVPMKEDDGATMERLLSSPAAREALKRALATEA